MGRGARGPGGDGAGGAPRREALPPRGSRAPRWGGRDAGELVERAAEPEVSGVQGREAGLGC